MAWTLNGSVTERLLLRDRGKRSGGGVCRSVSIRSDEDNGRYACLSFLQCHLHSDPSPGAWRNSSHTTGDVSGRKAGKEVESDCTSSPSWWNWDRDAVC